MKLALPAALLMTAATASAHSVIHGKAAQALMAKSLRRKLEDDEQEEEAEEEEEEENAWMRNYKLKFVGCAAGEKFQNQENGEYEYSSVIYRLCDASAECSTESAFGCAEGYGDYVVGINTYMQAYAESLEEDRRRRGLKKNFSVSGRKLEDEFNLREFAECGRIEYEQDEERRLDEEEEEVEYYVGPTCTEDGSDIMLSMYMDEDCSYASDVTFYELSGQALPYSEGGLAYTGCMGCTEQDDDGEYETSEFCVTVQEASGGCDQYDQTYCDKVEELTAEIREAEKSSSGWAVLGWIILAAIIVCVGWFAFKKFQEKKRASSSGVDTTPIGGGAMS